MVRSRAWRRYKNYTKAKRKRDIDFYDMYWWNYKTSNNPLDFSSNVGIYHNLHQYSKNKIHCSCPACSPKTRNKGKRRRIKPYAPSIDYTMMDLKRQQSMDADEKENNEMKYVRFYGDNGYCGCDYEEYISFEDNITEEEIEAYSNDIAYQNAESYEYMLTGRMNWENEDERESYYEDALSYCGWEYCTKEEFLENTEGD